MKESCYLTGQFLLAMPGIGDPRFDHAVIAMCMHDESGALGIGLGGEIAGLGFHDVLRQLSIDPVAAPDCGVCIGGPVEPGRGFVLHSRDWSGQDTVDVAGRWALSGMVDVLRAIAAGRGPTRWQVALGYAGWGAGQLEAEIQSNGWLHCEADPELLFDDGIDTKYQRALGKIGIDPAFLSREAGHA